MDEEIRIKALAKHLECNAAEIEVSSHDDTILTVGSGEYPSEYLVVDDSEADNIWEERLDSYLDECVLCELPDNLQCYFDEEAWKSDARIDGRGHSISGYDGVEHVIDVDGEELSIFRIN